MSWYIYIFHNCIYIYIYIYISQLYIYIYTYSQLYGPVSWIILKYTFTFVCLDIHIYFFTTVYIYIFTTVWHCKLNYSKIYFYFHVSWYIYIFLQLYIYSQLCGSVSWIILNYTFAFVCIDIYIYIYIYFFTTVWHCKLNYSKIHFYFRVSWCTYIHNCMAL